MVRIQAFLNRFHNRDAALKCLLDAIATVVHIWLRWRMACGGVYFYPKLTDVFAFVICYCLYVKCMTMMFELSNETHDTFIMSTCCTILKDIFIRLLQRTRRDVVAKTYTSPCPRVVPSRSQHACDYFYFYFFWFFGNSISQNQYIHTTTLNDSNLLTILGTLYKIGNVKRYELQV